MSKLWGNKAFYRQTLALAVPVMIQNGITNFVSLLDNIMVGKVGTEAMTGVSIVNTLMFVFNLCVFGAVSGAGIFSAQYYGKGDHDGVRYSFRFKIICSIIICAAAIGLFLFLGSDMISLYIEDDGSGLDPALVLSEGHSYLMVMLLGLLPFALVQSCAGTLRETGEAKLPMAASIVAVFVNLVLNYILIFGKFGAPALGVVGAAIATVIARCIELVIVYVGAFRRKKEFIFLQGAFRSMYIPMRITLEITRKGMPLFVNELLWASGMATMRQLYSSRGISVMASLNISSTASDLFSVVFLSMGTAIAIILGQQLGANRIEEAKRSAVKLITFSVVLSACVGVIVALVSPIVPVIYNQTGDVRTIAIQLMCANACLMPFQAFMNASYFTIRSGGKTLITFLFDSGFVWAIMIPVTWAVSTFTSLPILPLFIICQCTELLKCVVGFILVRSGTWAKNIVSEDETAAAAA